MTTRFEIIAQTFPLHAQRILELTERKEFLRQDISQKFLGVCFDNPYAILAGAFTWFDTEEGREYWSALAEGAQ